MLGIYDYFYSQNPCKERAGFDKVESTSRFGGPRNKGRTESGSPGKNFGRVLDTLDQVLIEYSARRDSVPRTAGRRKAKALDRAITKVIS